MRVLDDWLLTAERVAVHRPSATAVVADLHLGYAEARRRGGEAVPDDTLEEQLLGMGRVLHKHDVHRLVIAGDLLEDGRCHGALAAFEDWLNREGIELVALVPGNHDRGLETSSQATPKLPLYPDGFLLGDWRVLHGDEAIPDGPVIQGHEHPCFRWSPRRHVVRPRFFDRTYTPAVEGPCYLVGPRRLILPAFSREAVGVNVLSVRRWRPYRCLVIAGERVLDLGELAQLGQQIGRG